MKVVVIFLMTLALAACGSYVAPSSPDVLFQGHVLDFRTQTPVANALVQFTGDALFDIRATTDNAGRYQLTLPVGRALTASVDGTIAGGVIVGSSVQRGDLFVHGDTCAARYGVLLDAATHRPVAGATLTLLGATMLSDRDGWYRMDFGCPDVVLPGGTTVMSIAHPDYADKAQVVGRGVGGVQRIDVELMRK